MGGRGGFSIKRLYLKGKPPVPHPPSFLLKASSVARYSRLDPLSVSQPLKNRGKMRWIRGYSQEWSLKRERRPRASCLLYNCRKSPWDGGGGEREGEPRTKWRRPGFFLLPPTRHKLTTLRTYKRKGARALSRLYISLRARKRGWSRPSILIGYRDREGGEAVLPRVNSAPPTKRKSYECNFKSLVVYFFLSSSFTPMAFLSFIILFVGTFFHCFPTFSTLRPGKEQSGDFSHCRRYEKRPRLHGIAFRRD